MVDTRITKERLKNHLQYDWWKYLLTFLALLIVWNTVYSVTEYHPPAEKRIDIQLVGYYSDEEPIEQLKQDLLAVLDDQQEEVQVFQTMMSFSDASDSVDSNSIQKLQVQFAAKIGNVFVMPRKAYEMFAPQGAFVDMQPYLDDGTFALEEDPANLAIRMVENNEDGVYEEVGEPILCALPLSQCKGLEKYLGYDPAMGELVIAIPFYAQNMDNTIRTVQWFLAQE